MKKLTMVLFACVFAFGAFAELKKGWTLNLEKALETAKAENKTVLLVLSNLDSCGLCQRFDNNILKNSKFKSYAKKNFVCVNVDINKDRKLSVDEDEKAQMDARRKYAGRYKMFPGVFLIDPKTGEGTKIESPAGISIKDFLKTADKFRKEHSAGKTK